MFNNLTVRTRLFCLIGVMLLFVISLSFGGLYGMKKANDGLQTVYTDRVVPLKDLKIIADMYAVIVVDTTLDILPALKGYNGDSLLLRSRRISLLPAGFCC